MPAGFASANRKINWTRDWTRDFHRVVTSRPADSLPVVAVAGLCVRREFNASADLTGGQSWSRRRTIPAPPSSLPDTQRTITSLQKCSPPKQYRLRREYKDRAAEKEYTYWMQWIRSHLASDQHPITIAIGTVYAARHSQCKVKQL